MPPATSPADLDAAADRLAALADVVGTLLDRVVAFDRPDVWQGARADRFGRELDDQRAHLRAAARGLAEDAATLRARARVLRGIGLL
jgi:hypothetical protein